MMEKESPMRGRRLKLSAKKRVEEEDDDADKKRDYSD